MGNIDSQMGTRCVQLVPLPLRQFPFVAVPCFVSDMGSFAVRAQCEPRGLGVNTTKEVQLEGAIMRIQELLEQQPLFLVSRSKHAVPQFRKLYGT